MCDTVIGCHRGYILYSYEAIICKLLEPQKNKRRHASDDVDYADAS